MLEARHITLRYGARLAVDAVSLGVPLGRVVALCGPNGAGKSSLLSALCGDATPSAGEVHLSGAPLSALTIAELARARAVLEQSPSLSVAFTARELAMLGVPDEISLPEAEVICAGVLADLDLTRLEDRPVPQLSGGERHRAHLARVLAQLRAGRMRGFGLYLMLDEPTASLDIQHQIAVMQQARKAAEEGSGVIVVLHDLNLACAFADRVVLMRDGRIAVDGPPEEVLTSRILSDVYETAITVVPGPDGRPRIFPDYTSAKEHSAHVHRNEPFPRAAGSGGRV
ncbi:MAG: heme ABC transporter ATP-binding protein [Pseudomonadota bacterium]